LTQIGSNYYLSTGGTGITIKYAGSPIAQGQFGIWTPIGAEQTASGYSVVLKFGDADQYMVWSTDGNGNYLSNSAAGPGSTSGLTSLESGFQQDLNGDGVISSAAATIADSSAGNTGQSTVSLSEGPAFDFVNVPGSSGIDNWHFKSVSESGGAGISGPEDFFPGSAGSQFLTRLVREALVTTDETHETFGSHDTVPTKVLMVGLHADYLISH
ncbi:MAG: hypothetical protein Q7U75_08410, partial [Desulfobacterales bacterium]|nr:hypothetical protein [Desulfobacterales bacterium]